MNKKATLGIIFVFIGCCSNVIFLELLVKEEPQCGSLITGMQFLIVTIYGFIFTMKLGTKENIIPIKNYAMLGGMFLIVNELNNRAFAYKISMPLHIIFRSGGLIASMVMGMIVLGRRYSVQKYISVVAISIGTVLATLASSSHIGDASENTTNTDMTTWSIGIGILTFALFFQARMGIFQECLYKKHGKHPAEALFFFHLFSLTGMVFVSSNILEHVYKFNDSSLMPDFAAIPVIGGLPKMWIYAIAYTLTQFICINSVFVLTSECTSLTVMLVLTLRKFLSLVFSILYFQNAFTTLHWIGAGLVFGGTVMFSEPAILSRKKID